MQIQFVYFVDLDYILKTCFQLEEYTVFLLQQNIPCYNRLYVYNYAKKDFYMSIQFTPQIFERICKYSHCSLPCNIKDFWAIRTLSSRSMGKTLKLAVCQLSNLSLPHCGCFCHQEKQKLVCLQKTFEAVAKGSISRLQNTGLAHWSALGLSREKLSSDVSGREGCTKAGHCTNPRIVPVVHV